LKAEKIEKACNILRENLNITIPTDEIVEILKEREIEIEMLQQDVYDAFRLLEYYSRD